MCSKKTIPNISDSSKDDRQARLGAALRANLRRRKEQSRAKTASPPDKPGDSTEMPEVKEKP